MTDAEKYARVFRAAADGIANAAALDVFKVNPWKVERRPKSYGVGSGYSITYDFVMNKPYRPEGMTDEEWWKTVVLPISERDCKMFLREELDDEEYARHSAFSGIAEMFEKIVEAEAIA